MHILNSLFYHYLIIYNLSGELSEEEEVLQWLITQKTEDRIELITRQMLETMVEETQYLAVYFCKLQTQISKKTLFHNVTQYKLLSPGTTTAPLHRRTTLHHQHQPNPIKNKHIYPSTNQTILSTGWAQGQATRVLSKFLFPF